MPLEFKAIGDALVEKVSSLNSMLKGIEPLKLVLITVGTSVFVLYIHEISTDELGISGRLKQYVFDLAKKIPAVRAEIKQKEDEASEDIRRSMFKFQRAAKIVPIEKLDWQGKSEEEVLQLVKRYLEIRSVDWRDGKLSGAVYNADGPLTDLLTKVYKAFAWSNQLHPEVFPDTRLMEGEVVSMVAKMFHGDDSVCGSVSSGGTESILLAAKAYMHLAKSKGIKKPNMVVPETIHAAFHKACQLMGIEYRTVPLDKNTFKVDINKLKSAVNSNTCMIALSAPNFPHGIIDPVKQVAQFAKSRSIPLHVDCCLGGFILPFMHKAGFELEEFDFRLPGVTSISCDTHKYAYAPKGTSVIMYRNKEYLHHQYFVSVDWPGGVYASQTLGGSRAGVTIAGCWAAMLYFGEGGYVEYCRKIVSLTRELVERINAIDELYVIGEPGAMVVAFASDVINVYSLGDAMNKRKWHLSPLQYPSGLHLALTAVHTRVNLIENLISDLRECIEEVRSCPIDGSLAALYGASHSVPDRRIIESIVHTYLDAAGSTGKE